MATELAFGLIGSLVTYAYEGEHGYFRAWIDRHGWGDTNKARAVRLVPFVRQDGSPGTMVIPTGDRGQRSHRETKLNESCHEARARIYSKVGGPDQAGW